MALLLTRNTVLSRFTSPSENSYGATKFGTHSDIASIDCFWESKMNRESIAKPLYLISVVFVANSCVP